MQTRMMEALNKYLTEHKLKNHSIATIRSEDANIKRYIFEPLDTWIDVYTKRLEKFKGVTMYRELNRVKSFCAWCVRHRFLKSNPFKTVPHPKQEKVLPRDLPLFKIAAILEAAKEINFRAYAIFNTFCYTGLRKTELVNLTAENVNLNSAHPYIFIDQGKGQKDGLIMMNNKLRPILAHWDQMRDKTHRRFFNLSDSGIRRLRDSIEEKVHFHFCIHQLRHTFATTLLNEGTDVVFVSKLMRHSNITTTMRYLGVAQNKMSIEIDKLNFSIV